MAREESDREDLLREATALVPRVELRIGEEQVFIGFRGAAGSVYFNGDPVYHFNGAGELRRAFVDRLLYKAVRGVLQKMERVRSDKGVELRSETLTSEAQQEVLTTCWDRLATVQTKLAARAYALVGQWPAEGDALPRVEAWIGGLLTKQLSVADSPQVG